MIAELHKKLSGNPSGSEDELTGNVFGTLRYLSFQKGLKKLLCGRVYPKEIAAKMEDISSEAWAQNIQFWKRYPFEGGMTEPDIVLSFQDIVIMIEVKYRSGLSTEDGISYEDLKEGITEENYSCNQLAREARLLKQIAGKRKAVLLLLADEMDCRKYYKDIIRRGLCSDVAFGTLSWQDVLVGLKGLGGLSCYEMLMVADLVRLLEKKIQTRFCSMHAGMDSCQEVDKNQEWEFPWENQSENVIDYNYAMGINRRDYYEFG